MVHPEGFEPTTLCSEDRCSNPLSYGCLHLFQFITPRTFCLQGLLSMVALSAGVWQDGEIMRPPLQIIVAEQLIIDKSQLPSKVKRFLHEKLFILNSEYIIKERLGKPTYDVAKFFDLVEDDGAQVKLPRGFARQLTEFLGQEGIAYQLTPRHPEFGACGFRSNIVLTDSQRRVIDQASAAGEGIIVAPPGSGKTVMGLELIARHDKPALILTHRKQLLDQWVERIQQHLDLPKKQIGRYSASYKKPSDVISVGLLQSFARAGDLSEFTDKFGVIIIDECHHIPAKTFRAVISQLNGVHIYGLTATPKRKHNDEKLIYLYIGNIVATLASSEKVPEIGVSICETSLTLPFDWKTDRSELLAKVICYDTARNEQLVRDMLQQVARQRRILVLSERKEHLGVLALYLRSKAKVLVLSGDDGAGERASKYARIDSGDYDILLATGQLLGEGVHIATIDTLMLAFPFAFEGKLIQYVGRLLHSDHPGQVIDYRDQHIAVLERQYKQRQRYYNKLEKQA